MNEKKSTRTTKTEVLPNVFSNESVKNELLRDQAAFWFGGKTLKMRRLDTKPFIEESLSCSTGEEK